jgi:hypothetical protein
VDATSKDFIMCGNCEKEDSSVNTRAWSSPSPGPDLLQTPESAYTYIKVVSVNLWLYLFTLVAIVVVIQ